MSPDGKYLVVALGHADQVGYRPTSRAGSVGRWPTSARYPYGVGDRPGPSTGIRSASERDGTVTVISISRKARPIATIPIDLAAGPVKAGYSIRRGWPPNRCGYRLYVAVTDRDLVTVVDTESLKLTRSIEVEPAQKPLSAQRSDKSSACRAEGRDAYVANAGEDAITARRTEATARRARSQGSRAPILQSALAEADQAHIEIVRRSLKTKFGKRLKRRLYA